jgi:hypothetical protein
MNVPRWPDCERNPDSIDQALREENGALVTLVSVHAGLILTPVVDGPTTSAAILSA